MKKYRLLRKAQTFEAFLNPESTFHTGGEQNSMFSSYYGAMHDFPCPCVRIFKTKLINSPVFIIKNLTKGRQIHVVCFVFQFKVAICTIIHCRVTSVCYIFFIFV